MKHSIIGVDLAKDVIQICEVRGGKVISNKELSASDFGSWLATTKKATIVLNPVRLPITGSRERSNMAMMDELYQPG